MPDDIKLNAVIDAYADQAYGSETDSGELARQRALALDAYAAKNIEPAPKGRSQVVDHSVFETVQQILPSLVRIFANGDKVVEFEPTGPEDEEPAEQESEYLNYIVTQKNNWFLTCNQWFQDALLTKNAYCMVTMDEKLDTEVEEYERMSEEQAMLLLEDKDLEVVGQNVYPDPDYEPTPLVDPSTGIPVMDEFGQPVIQPPPNLVDLQVKKVRAKKKLRFDVLAPERCRIDEATPDFTLEECNYFEYWEKLPISDLRRMGFDVPDDIAGDIEGDAYDTEEDTARDEILGGEYDFADSSDIPDASQKRVKVRTIWVRFDYDEDGIAELQKVIRVGREILLREPASRIPVASIVPYLNTHRHMGNSVADLTFDIQRIKTALLRGGLDAMYLANNPRHAVSDKVHMADLLTARPGAPVRLKGGAIPGEGHVMPMQTENVFPMAQEGLMYMDRVKQARVGVDSTFSGIDIGDMMGQNSYNAIGQLSTMASQRVEQIARIFANGVERLFSLAHELIIKSGHQAESVRLRGQWVDIDPSQWRTGRDMRVVAPFAAGNKDSLIQRLMIHMQVHREALAAGAPFVQMDDTYELASELAKATDLPPEKFYTDPELIPPPEPAPDYTMIALETENRKIDQQAVEAEQKVESDQFKSVLNAEMDKYKVDKDAEVKIALAQLEAGLNAELEAVKSQLNEKPTQTQAIAKRSEEASMSTQSLVTKTNKELQKTIKDLKATISDIQADINAPAEVVRENGKIVGVKKNGKLRKVSG